MVEFVRFDFPDEFYRPLAESERTGILRFTLPRDLGFPELRKDFLLEQVSDMYDRLKFTPRMAFVVFVGDVGRASATQAGAFWEGIFKSYQVLGLLSFYVPQAFSYYLSYVFPSVYGCAFCENVDMCSRMSNFLFVHGLASGVQVATMRISEDPGVVFLLSHVLEYLRMRRVVLDSYIGWLDDILTRGFGDEGSDQR